MTQLSLNPIFSVLLQLAATVILALGSWAIARLTRWLNLKSSAQLTEALDTALQKSVIFGLQQSQEEIRAKGWDSVEVKNAALAVALPYMTSRFGDTLKLVGVDVNNPAALTQTVKDALDRAFPSAATQASASPATPPTTAPNPSHTSELPPTQTVNLLADRQD